MATVDNIDTVSKVSLKNETMFYLFVKLEVIVLLPIPFICQLRSAAKMNKSAICEFLTIKDMLHYFIFGLRIDADCCHSVLKTVILN